MRSLIIEDESISRKLISTMLETYGPCHTSRDGLAGMEAWLEAIEGGTPFDLVTVDLQMPNMDGHGVLKLLRKMERVLGLAPERRTPVIVVSGQQTKGEILSSFRDGSNAFLSKPVQPEELDQQIRRLGVASGTAKLQVV